MTLTTIESTEQASALLTEARPQMLAARNELKRRLDLIEVWFARFGKRRHQTIRKYLPIMRHERRVLRAKLALADRILNLTVRDETAPAAPPLEDVT